jgi:pimeloyl-ACP methyl ester carboxylesterase
MAMPAITAALDRRDDTPPLGELYDVGGGRRLMLYHAGTSRPAVVIEAGAGAFGLDYLLLLEAIAPRTTCVLYDRAGSGWSDPASASRSAQEIVSDLHDALGLAGVDAPYLLVGHSFGGMLALAFAQSFPQNVVGMVLIDPLVAGIPLPEGGDEEAVVVAMVDKLQRHPDLLQEWYPQLFSEWEKMPASVRQPLIAQHLDPDRVMAGARDMVNARRIHDDVTRGPTAPDVPIIVLTGMEIDSGPGASDENKRAFNQIKLDAHSAFVRSLPHGEHKILDDAGHFLFVQRPDVVLAAVFEILDRAASR